jgi:hypothetical protein
MLWIQGGLEPFGGGNRSILIHTQQADAYGDLFEEALVHEAGHTSLHFDTSAAWRAAQQADHEFISDYAHDFPDSEDVPESFLPYLAVRLKPNRIDAATRATIVATMPNRIFYLDSIAADVRPMLRAPGTTAGQGSPAGSTYEVEMLVARGQGAGREVARMATGIGDFQVRFDGVAESLPAYCCGSHTRPSVIEGLHDDGHGQATLAINIVSSDGGDLFPGGRLGPASRQRLTDGLLRLGYFTGSDALDWTPASVVVSATIDLLANGRSLTGGPVALLPKSFGAPGPWNGNLALTLANRAGKGVDAIALRIVVRKSSAARIAR